jgi:hypothetical protein
MKPNNDKVDVMLYPIINYIASEIKSYDSIGFTSGQIPIDTIEMNKILEVFKIPYDHPNKFDIVLETAKQYFQNRKWKIIHNKDYEPVVYIQFGPKVFLNWSIEEKI